MQKKQRRDSDATLPRCLPLGVVDLDKADSRRGGSTRPTCPSVPTLVSAASLTAHKLTEMARCIYTSTTSHTWRHQHRYPKEQEQPQKLATGTPAGSSSSISRGGGRYLSIDLMAALLWWPLSPWLSPAAAWFIFFNAVVGAIALMSCTASEHQPDSRLSSAPSRRRLGRSGSSMVLDRLRSFSIFSVVSTGVTGAPIDDDDHNASAAASTGSQFYRYGTPEAEAAAASATRELAPEQPERGPEAVTATTGGAATSSAATPTALAPAEEDHAPPAPAPPVNAETMAQAEAEEEHDESISMDEAYALAQRRRAQAQAQAQELASPSPSPPPPTPPPASTTATATATARAKKPAATMAAGVSRRRTKAKETLVVEGKAELNARAELFIRQFREELKLQRLNSILGHAHALRSPTAAAR